LVLWQASQLSPVARWLVPLPVARWPLWQLLQPLVMPVWSKAAGSQATVEWQVSQGSLVWMCPGGLPVACTLS
jgi:hypothetical protein